MSVCKESRIINRVWTSAWPHERDGQACDIPSFDGSRKRETKWRNKRSGSKKSNSDENALRNSLFRSSFFTSTFLREANHVKADVLETKPDLSDPSQLEFRFTQKLERPWLFHLTFLPCSAPPCFTILSSFTPFNSAFFGIYLTPRIS